MPTFDPSLVTSIRALRERYPDTPFLTLGQTVWWDEPAKASFCRALEVVAPDANIVAAIHDTDYFAKLPVLEDRSRKFVLVPHNDGNTRGLWSAAGELSCLFGSETVPTRSLLTEFGVAFDRVARHYPGGDEGLLNTETAAWGWRAIVHTEPRPLIAADVILADIAPALLEQLEWGFEETLLCIEEPARGRETAGLILSWVREYIESHPDHSLSDLYRWLTSRLWMLVRGEGACNLQTSSSLELFRFNRDTVSLPRFNLIDLFLQPATREVASRCYDDAVRGSGIYTLNEFGPGALPFDVVIPGRGRGTLRLHEGSLYIKTEDPITLCTGCDCGSAAELAAVLEDKFGPGIALVGKAVTLISMLAREFIFVFHESASGYTVRTRKMNELLRLHGIGLDMHPLLRVRYNTWSAIEGVPVNLRLPPHLARAFDTQTISASAFAERWVNACESQERLCDEMKSCASARELLSFLALRYGSPWTTRLEEYTAAREAIRQVRSRAEVLEREADDLVSRARDAGIAAQEAQRKKGIDFRLTVQPMRERIADLKEGSFARLTRVDENGRAPKLSRQERALELERQALEEGEIEDLRSRIANRQGERSMFDKTIVDLLQQARSHRAAARAKTLERVDMERGETARKARRSLIEIEYEAELERLRMVRDAILVSRGLRYTNFRPAAWWFPLVSPDGEWLTRLTETATARIEEI